MPFMEISVNPLGTNTPSFSSYISKACELVHQQGMQYQVTPTCTVVEGEVEELFSLAQKIHNLPLENGADRVLTNIVIDERTDKSTSYADAVQAATQSRDQ